MSAEDFDRINRTIGEIKAASQIQIITTALGADALRELYVRGHNELANKHAGGEHQAKVRMDLLHEIETSIRNGKTLTQAIDAAITAGYLNKLEGF